MPAWITSLLRELIPEPMCALALDDDHLAALARPSARATASPRTPAPITRHSTDSIRRALGQSEKAEMVDDHVD